MRVPVVLQAAPKRIGSGRSKRNMDEGVKLVKVGQKILEDSSRLSGVNPKLSSAPKGGNQLGRKSSAALAVPAGCTGDADVGGVDERVARVARRTAKADAVQDSSGEDGELRNSKPGFYGMQNRGANVLHAHAHTCLSSLLSWPRPRICRLPKSLLFSMGHGSSRPYPEIIDTGPFTVLFQPGGAGQGVS
jgi:hypothetical protein